MEDSFGAVLVRVSTCWREQILQRSECAFETVSVIDAGDLRVVATFAVFLLLIGLTLRATVFSLIFQVLARSKALNKWNQSCWEMTYFLFSFCLGCAVVAHSPWAFDPNQYWQAYPQLSLSLAHKTYIWLGLAYYVQGVIVLVLVDERRADFWEMLVHHFVTICVILCAYFSGYNRVAAVTLCLHDVADILLHAAKLLNYMQSTRTCAAMFILFALTFTATRMVLFPMILWSAIFEHDRYNQSGLTQYMARFLLLVLQGLHAFWFRYILSMLPEVLSTWQVTSDYRSDEDADSPKDKVS